MFIGNIGHEHSLMYFLNYFYKCIVASLVCLVVVCFVVVVGGPTDSFFA